MRHAALLAALALALCCGAGAAAKYDVHWLSGSTTIEREAPGSKEAVDIYCYRGSTKNLLCLWQTVKFHIKINSEDFRHYTGGTPEEAYSTYAGDSYGWSVLPFQTKHPKTTKLNPFNTTCVAVNTKQRHSIELQLIHVDLWRVLALVVGLTLFFSSRALSGNPLFFYLCGIFVGICASFMVLVYYIGKLCPRKPLMYSVMVGGWTFGLYIFQQMWENIRAILLSYQTHIFWYTFIIGFISFLVCYRIGPPRNERSKNLVMWTLQVIGLLLVFFSSDFQEASAAIIIKALIFKYFPMRILHWARKQWCLRFPPKPRLLSNEEYYEQGARETKNALDNLRKHCSSPDCAQWKIMLKLNDSKRSISTSPNHPSMRSKWKPPDHRFASFVEGESHLSDDEILGYESYAFSTSSPRKSPRNHVVRNSVINNSTVNNLNIDNISSDDSSESSEEEL